MEPDYSSLLINKILQERSRLLIVSYLMGKESQKAAFMELQKALNLTRGNLSIQIKKLIEAGYVGINKEFRDNKPLSTISLLEKGVLALKNYLAELSKLLDFLPE